MKRYGDIVAVCDVDREHAESAKDDPKLGNGKADIYEDYRKLLDRKDIDVVTIGTPDHWHTQIAIDAMRAGKDVYCEKPLTLTIDEGKQLRKVVKETKRIFQVGTQQRSEDKNMFLTAVAMVRDGRIGKIKRVTCAIGATPDEGKTFRKTEPPAQLNWDMWLGQAPQVDYIAERCHNEFRWWYEYSGGKMTDWGAHHVDIAQWAIGMEQSGPTTVEVVTAEHPVPFKDGMPTVDDRYNTATTFLVRCLFPNDVEMLIRHDTENGIMFEGEKGTFFVSRGKLVGRTRRRAGQEPAARVGLDRAPQGQATRQPHGQLLRVRPRPSHAGLRRLLAPPDAHHLPPRQHRDPARADAHLGPGQRTDRRRPRGQQVARPRAAQGVRDRRLSGRLGSHSLGPRARARGPRECNRCDVFDVAGLSPDHDASTRYHSMNTDRIHTQRIQTLSYWTRPVTIEPLPGGITNPNYLVSDAGHRYVARALRGQDAARDRPPQRGRLPQGGARLRDRPRTRPPGRWHPRHPARLGPDPCT